MYECDRKVQRKKIK